MAVRRSFSYGISSPPLADLSPVYPISPQKATGKAHPRFRRRIGWSGKIQLLEPGGQLPRRLPFPVRRAAPPRGGPEHLHSEGRPGLRQVLPHAPGGSGHGGARPGRGVHRLLRRPGLPGRGGDPRPENRPGGRHRAPCGGAQIPRPGGGVCEPGGVLRPGGPAGGAGRADGLHEGLQGLLSAGLPLPDGGGPDRGGCARPAAHPGGGGQDVQAGPGHPVPGDQKGGRGCRPGGAPLPGGGDLEGRPVQF